MSLNKRKEFMPDWSKIDKTIPHPLMDLVSLSLNVRPGCIFQCHPKVQSAYFKRLEAARKAIESGELKLAKDRA